MTTSTNFFPVHKVKNYNVQTHLQPTYLNLDLGLKPTEVEILFKSTDRDTVEIKVCWGGEQLGAYEKNYRYDGHDWHVQLAKEIQDLLYTQAACCEHDNPTINLQELTAYVEAGRSKAESTYGNGFPAPFQDAKFDCCIFID